MSATDTLAASEWGLRFLGRHPSLSRKIGSSADYTQSYLAADALDRDQADIGKFRGISTSFPFSRNSLEDANQSLTLNPAFARGLELRTEDEAARAVDEVSRLIAEDQWYIRPDGEVRDLLSSEKDLQRAYTNDFQETGYKQEAQLAEFAGLVISAATGDAEWLPQPDVARLALENRGGFGDLLKDDDTLQSYLTTPADEVLLDESRERAKSAVLELLPNSSDILDEEFFDEFPLTALRLLERPDIVDWIERDTDNAKQFKQDAGLLTEEIRGRLSEEADKIVENDPFDERFFDANLNLAEVVWADNLTGHENDYGTFLNGVEVLREDAQATDLAAQYWTKQASKQVNNDSFPNHLFEQNNSLAMMAALNTDVSFALSAEAESIHISYPNKSGLSQVTRAFRGYGLGLGDRQYGDYLRVA